MITQLEVHGFKRFYRKDFELKNLSILAGINGSGKTSLIHALLIAWEATDGGSKEIVRLNGPFDLQLGTAEDIRNWKSKDIELSLHEESGHKATWKFGIQSDDALYLTVQDKPSRPPTAFSRSPRCFSYLCAERLGPRSVLSASPLPHEWIEVGVRGEQCAQILATIGDKKMEYSERLHPTREKNAPTLLKYEVEHWLAEIARPVEIDASRYYDSSVTALRFRSPGGMWVHAPNMGFGVSYALPVILAGLIAATGGLLIVENPEAHLHPRGQSCMGAFLAWIAGRGVQVILETHSDHILNGVRRAIGELGYLGNDKAVVHYFESGESDEAQIQQLDFTPLGGLSNWPQGFFDQYQIDVASLGRLRRRG